MFLKLIRSTFKKVVDSASGKFHYVYNTSKKKSQWHVPHLTSLENMDPIELGTVAPPNRHGALCGSLFAFNHRHGLAGAEYIRPLYPSLLALRERSVLLA